MFFLTYFYCGVAIQPWLNSGLVFDSPAAAALTAHGFFRMRWILGSSSCKLGVLCCTLRCKISCVLHFVPLVDGEQHYFTFATCLKRPGLKTWNIRTRLREIITHQAGTCLVNNSCQSFYTPAPTLFLSYWSKNTVNSPFFFFLTGLTAFWATCSEFRLSWVRLYWARWSPSCVCAAKLLLSIRYGKSAPLPRHSRINPNTSNVTVSNPAVGCMDPPLSSGPPPQRAGAGPGGRLGAGWASAAARRWHGGACTTSRPGRCSSRPSARQCRRAPQLESPWFRRNSLDLQWRGRRNKFRAVQFGNWKSSVFWFGNSFRNWFIYKLDSLVPFRPKFICTNISVSQMACGLFSS